MKKEPIILTAFAAIGISAPAPAQLVYHWEFDADGTSAVGDNNMIIHSNASVSSFCSKIGDGSIRVSRNDAPPAGGANTESAVNWDLFANGDTRTIAMLSLIHI